MPAERQVRLRCAATDFGVQVVLMSWMIAPWATRGRHSPSSSVFVSVRQASLVRLGWSLTGDRQLGEDLAQAALARLWTRWATVSSGGDPWPYLQRVAVSLASSWRRRRWRGEVPSLSVPDVVDHFDGVVSVQETDSVERWLALLPVRQRAVIVLRFLFDLSVADSADRLGCSEGTVKSQTAKALRTLREYAEATGEPTEAESTS